MVKHTCDFLNESDQPHRIKAGHFTLLYGEVLMDWFLETPSLKLRIRLDIKTASLDFTFLTV